MSNVAIITDSCADLPESYFSKYKIDVVNMSFILNEKEYLADISWNSLSQKDYYSELKNGSYVHLLPATELEIRTVLEKHLKRGEDIVYIACPKKLSTTILKARNVANELLMKYTKAEVYIMDARNASCGQGMLALEACRLRDEGKGAKEIMETVHAMRHTVLEYCSPEFLAYLSKANKVKSYTAAMGDLFNIKPIIISDTEGSQVSFKKVKGREQCLNEILKLIQENAIDLENQTLFIAHADDDRIVAHIQEMIELRGIKCKEIVPVCFGPIVGTSVGPGTIAVFCYGNEVTFTGA